MKNGSKNTSVDIVGLGEIMIKQGRKSLVFSFSSFFPATFFPGVRVKEENLKNPMELVKKINKWKEKKKPVHFIATGIKVNKYCIINNFQYNQAGGDVGTIYYDIELVEYRKTKARKIKKKKKKKKRGGSVAKRGRTNSKSSPSTYSVKKGDCLYNIARKFYGNGSKYTKIYNANKKVIGSNPNIIRPGMILKIPS